MNLSNQKLQDHYDRKYAGEKILQKRISINSNPLHRVQMAAKYVCQNNNRGGYLEIGAGDGSLALTILDNYDFLVLLEISQHRFDGLTELFKEIPKVEVSALDIEQEGLSKYPDNYFDTVCMIDVIEHMIEPIFVLNEIFRVIRPDGRLIINTPNIAKWTRRIKLLAGCFPSTASLREGLVHYDKKNPTDIFDEGHLHYFTFRSLSRLGIERAGFRSVEWHGYGRTFLSKIWPTMFSDVFVIFSK
jgi:SAM-dependent methyltransferase